MRVLFHSWPELGSSEQERALTHVCETHCEPSQNMGTLLESTEHCWIGIEYMEFPLAATIKPRLSPVSTTTTLDVADFRGIP
jgi:hypothetical protein